MVGFPCPSLYSCTIKPCQHAGGLSLLFVIPDYKNFLLCVFKAPSPSILINTTVMGWATTLFSHFMIFKCLTFQTFQCGGIFFVLLLVCLFVCFYIELIFIKDDDVPAHPALSLPATRVSVLVPLITPLNPNAPVLAEWDGFQIFIIWEFLSFSRNSVDPCIHNQKSWIMNTANN